MAIPEQRMSTTVVTADFIHPDELDRDLNEDYEAGPVGVGDSSLGLFYQDWHLTYGVGTGDFTVTPALTGSPQVIINVANVTQCSFCFDQNGGVTIAYTVGGAAFLYWYDTQQTAWVTDQLDFGVTTPTLTLDDKRPLQIQNNDILLWYTKDVGGGVYNLYHRMQRERFQTEYEMLTAIPPYIYKLGMHQGLRVQIGLSAVVI